MDMKDQPRVSFSIPTAEPGQPIIRSPKRRGEVVELAFLCKAVSLGFSVAQPYGDSECYDFIVHSRADSPPKPGKNSSSRLSRVQVKSTERFRKGGYLIGACHFSVYGTKQSYTADQIDFLVAFIVPENAWYVLPVRAFVPHKWLSFYPQNPHSKGRFEPYREAWDLMAHPRTP